MIKLHRLRLSFFSLIIISLMVSGFAMVSALDVTEPTKMSDEDWVVGMGTGIRYNYVTESLADPISRDVYVSGIINGTDGLGRCITRIHHNGTKLWSIDDPYDSFFTSGLLLGENGTILYNCFSKNISGTYSSFLRKIDANSGEILENITIRENSSTIVVRMEFHPTDSNRLFLSIYSHIELDTIIYDFDLETGTPSWNYTLLPLDEWTFSIPKCLTYNPEDDNLYYAGYDGNMAFSYGARIYKIEPTDSGTRTLYNLTAEHPIMTRMSKVKVLGERIYLLGDNYSGPGDWFQYLQIMDLDFTPIQLLEFKDQYIRFSDIVVIDDEHLVLGGYHYSATFQANDTDLGYTTGLIMLLSKGPTDDMYKTDAVHFFGKSNTTVIATMSYVPTTGELYVGGYSKGIVEGKTLACVAKYSSIYGTMPEPTEGTVIEELIEFFTTINNWIGIGVTAGLVFVLTLIFSLLIRGKKGKK
ncbi:MAG: YncE family protein [Promethearchaeota archaeon]